MSSTVLKVFDAELNALDREALREFFSSAAGARVMRNLYTLAPTPTDANGDLAFRAGRAAGWRSCVEHLIGLVRRDESLGSAGDAPPPGAHHPNYPDLEDESQWDGATPKA